MSNPLGNDLGAAGTGNTVSGVSAFPPINPGVSTAPDSSSKTQSPPILLPSETQLASSLVNILGSSGMTAASSMLNYTQKLLTALTSVILSQTNSAPKIPSKSQDARTTSYSDSEPIPQEQALPINTLETALGKSDSGHTADERSTSSLAVLYSEGQIPGQPQTAIGVPAIAPAWQDYGTDPDDITGEEEKLNDDPKRREITTTEIQERSSRAMKNVFPVKNGGMGGQFNGNRGQSQQKSETGESKSETKSA